MGTQALRAVFDAVLGIGEMAAAILPKSIQRAIAEKAAEGFRIRTPVAREILALFILEKVVMAHTITPLPYFSKTAPELQEESLLWWRSMIVPTVFFLFYVRNSAGAYYAPLRCRTIPS